MSAVATPVGNPPIKMTLVLEVLRECEAIAAGLNGEYPSGFGQRERNASEARLARTLLNLSDQLTLASTLVRNEYWAMKDEGSYEL